MKKLILFFVILAFVPNVHTQVTKIDSLQHLLKTAKEDTSKINLIIQIGREITFSSSVDNTEAFTYANNALNFSKKINFQKGIGDAYYLLGHINYREGKYESALNDFRKSVKQRKIAKDQAGLAKSFNYIGDTKCMQFEYDSAKFYYHKCLDIEIKLENRKRISGTYSNIGATFSDEEKFDSSLYFFNNALKIANEINDTIQIAMVLNNIGVVYKKQGQYEKAIELYLKAARYYEKSKRYENLSAVYDNIASIYNQIEDYEKAKKFTEMGLNYAKKSDNQILIARLYNQLGQTYSYLGDYNKSLESYERYLSIIKKHELNDEIALGYNNIANLFASRAIFDTAYIYFQKGIEYVEKTSSIESKSLLYMNFGRINYALKKYDVAIQFFNKAIDVARSIGLKYYEKQSLLLLSDLYRDINSWDKAYKYHIEYSEIKDSIDNASIKSQISELQIQYETEKKDQQIALLEKEKQITDAETKRKNILIASSVGGFVLIVLVLFLFYNRQQLKKQNLLQKELTGAVVKGQDEERKRIAKDLHDGLGTLLSTARINVNTLEDKIPVGNENKKLFDNALQIIDKLNSEVRYIAQNLMPETLNEFGLVAAVEELIDAINRTGKLKITFKHYELSNELEKQLETNLYRIIQEIVNNTIKHSKATQLSMELVQHEDSMVLLTEDNGIGFNSENKSQTGMGIKNIQARLNLFNGALHIDSHSNKGTITTIEIPLLA